MTQKNPQKATFRRITYRPAKNCKAGVFLIVSFKTKAWMYRLAVKRLTDAGFLVHVYEYTWRPLLDAQPQDWPAFSTKLAKNIEAQVQKDLLNCPDIRFGIIGVSVGSILAMHAAKLIPSLERIMLVTMYGNSALHVWEHPSLQKMRTKLESQGLNQEGAYALFGHVEPTLELERIGERPILLFANRTDPVIRFSNTQLFIDEARRLNIPIEVRMIRAARHSFTIVKAFKDFKTWLSFFEQLR